MPIIVVVSFLTGISPVQTPFENPGMNNFTTNLGPSQQPPGIKIYVRYLLYDVCQYNCSFLTENSPIPMQNPGMNPITNNLGPSQQPPNIYTLKLRNTQTFPYAYNCNCSFLTGNSPIPIQNPGMNRYTNSK